MNKAKRIARGKELFRLINEASEHIEKWEAELGSLFSDSKPETTRRKSEVSAKVKAATTSANGNGRGRLTAALRVALKSMPAEFTGRELIEAAGVEKKDEASAFAAISRMDLKLHEIRKSTTTPGKYRRASTSGSRSANARSVISKVAQTVSKAVASIPERAAATIPERILALLASEPETTFDAPAIAKRFGVSDAVGLNSIRGALSRLSRDGEIEKVGRGDYRAKGDTKSR
jgi:hypothetical protein